MATLTIVSGNQAGTSFKLASRTLAIGRDPARDIQITDPKVSRKHALLRCDDGTHLIAAAKALNGMMVNGREIEAESVLRDGDIITIGDTDLRFSRLDSDQTNALHYHKDVGRENRVQNTVM